MTEYCHIQIIKRTHQDDRGQIQNIEFDWIALSDKAKEGWKMHTLFPDPSGTCLLERTVEQTVIQHRLTQAEADIKGVRAALYEIVKRKWYQFWK